MRGPVTMCHAVLTALALAQPPVFDHDWEIPVTVRAGCAMLEPCIHCLATHIMLLCADGRELLLSMLLNIIWQQ